MAEKLAKIAVTVEADEALDQMVARVNDGFLGGRVGKQELASWAIKHLAEQGVERFVDEIRAAHFDQVAYLASVMKELRAAKRKGGAALDMRAMLAPLVAGQAGTGVDKPNRARKAGATAPDINKPMEAQHG